MSYAIPLRAPVRLRLGLMLALMAMLSISMAPSAVRAVTGKSHAEICHCAHCPGEALCCCTPVSRCPLPQGK